MCSVRSESLQWPAHDRRGMDRPGAIAFRGKVFRQSSPEGLAWKKAKDLRHARRAQREKGKKSGRAKGEATFRRLGEAEPALNRNVFQELAGAVRRCETAPGSAISVPTAPAGWRRPGAFGCGPPPRASWSCLCTKPRPFLQ